MNTMTFTGQIRNGVIVLDENTVLPEGARVQVEVASSSDSTPNGQEEQAGLGQLLLRFAGTVRGLPSDMAEQHDHYTHGCSKK